MTRELTNSMRSKFNACHRAFKICYEDLIRPNKTSDALTFGTAMHSLLEEYWGGAEAKFVSTKDEYTDMTVKALYEGYMAHYGNDERYERVGAEIRFDAPLINPDTMAPSKTWHLSGKIDAIAVDKETGMHVIVEHKTSGMDIAPGSDYWKKLSIDGQVSGYFVGAQTKGYNIDICLYDVIRKPTIKPLENVPVLDEEGLKIVLDQDGNRVYTELKNGTKKPRLTGDADKGWYVKGEKEKPMDWYIRLREDIDSRPEYYYQRVEVARSNNDLEEYLFDMWAVGREIADAEKMERWSRNPNACSVFGSCEYFDVCTNCASLDDVTLFHKIETPNPELN